MLSSRTSISWLGKLVPFLQYCGSSHPTDQSIRAGSVASLILCGEETTGIKRQCEMQYKRWICFRNDSHSRTIGDSNEHRMIQVNKDDLNSSGQVSKLDLPFEKSNVVRLAATTNGDWYLVDHRLALQGDVVDHEEYAAKWKELDQHTQAVLVAQCFVRSKQPLTRSRQTLDWTRQQQQQS